MLQTSRNPSLENFTYVNFLDRWKNPNLTPTLALGEIAPTELDTIYSSGGFSVVGPDKLSVSYAGQALHAYDVGAVRANKPVPRYCLLFYFELLVENAGDKGQIAIGFTPPAFSHRRQPGWELCSCGYHGDDGLLYCGSGKGIPFGPTYASGDVVGAGVNNAKQEIFFTKNGMLIKSVKMDLKGILYPTVAVHSQNEKVTVNFGKDPFVFEVEKYEEEQRTYQQLCIDILILPHEQDASYGIVRSYLGHYGYEETLQLLDMACKITVPPITSVPENDSTEDDNLYALNQRRTIRQLVMHGRIDDAFTKLQAWFPQIIQDDTSIIGFLLHCQNFVELVRVVKLEEAVFYGRSQLVKFKRSSELNDLMKDCATLLVHESPHKSCAGYLLQESRRELLADRVNALILSTHPNVNKMLFTDSTLETLLKQLTICSLYNASNRELGGEVFLLHRFLKSCKS